MLGAILGDIIGCTYEHHNRKSKNIELFTKWSRVTDDSDMTIAVAEAFLRAKAISLLEDEASVKELLVDSLQKWGNEYPNAGYGGRFRQWLAFEERDPYNSWGNGSAMRVSPAGWIGMDMNEVRRLARWSAEVTHNHPEGVKGAEAIAAAVYLARTGGSKAEIKAYVETAFGYDLDRTCDEIRPGYTFDVSCQGSVPEAIIAFLDGEGFEDVIRNAVSLGGDSDRIAAMAGSIAEPYFGIPEWMHEKAYEYMDDDMIELVESFREVQ